MTTIFRTILSQAIMAKMVQNGCHGMVKYGSLQVLQLLWYQTNVYPDICPYLDKCHLDIWPTRTNVYLGIQPRTNVETSLIYFLIQ